MLEELRKQSKSTIIVFLFGIIIIVFIFSFGAGSVGFREGGCGRSDIAAVVNSEKITDIEYSYHLDRLLDAYRGQSQSIKPEDRIQIRRQALQDLIRQSLLTQSARKSGLFVTDEERNESIRKLPWVQDNNQQFDFTKYKTMVQRYLRTSLPVFEEIYRKDLLADRMRHIIESTARVTDDELKAQYIAQETKIDLSLMRISADVYKTELEPTEDQLAGFLSENEKQVKEFYDSNASRYNQPKQVKAAHIFFEVRKEYDDEQVQEKKEQAYFTADDLKKGAAFEEQAKDYSEDETTRDQGGELPMLQEEALAARWGEPFAKAAFALQPGGLSEVIKSSKGFHILKLISVQEAEHHPFDEAKQAIAKELLVTRMAKEKAESEAQRILDQLKSGKAFADLAPVKPSTGSGISQTPGVQSTGWMSLVDISQRGGYIPNLGKNEEILKQAFQLSKANPVPDTIYTVESPFGLPNYFVVKLNDRQEADLTAFKDAKEALRSQVLNQRRLVAFQNWVEQEMNQADIKENSKILMDSRSSSRAVNQ